MIHSSHSNLLNATAISNPGKFSYLRKAVSGTLWIHSHTCLCLHQSHNFHFMAFLYTPMGKSSTILNALWEGIGRRGGSWAAIAISFLLINFRISYCKVTKEVCWVLSGTSLHFQRFYRELLSLQYYIFIPIHVYPSLLFFNKGSKYTWDTALRYMHPRKDAMLDVPYVALVLERVPAK